MTAITAKPGQVLGFCYVTGEPLAMTPAEWRAAYPPTHFRRVAESGETAYYRVAAVAGRHVQGRMAEAYAIIPAGRASV